MHAKTVLRAIRMLTHLTLQQPINVDLVLLCKIRAQRGQLVVFFFSEVLQASQWIA